LGLAAELIEHVGWLDKADPEELANARLSGAELDEMRQAFGRYGDGLWTGHKNLRAIVSDIEAQWTPEEARKVLWSFLDVIHRDNNQLLHSTVSSLHRAFSGPDPDGGRVWVGPSNVHCEQALLAAYWTYAQTITLASDRFGFEDCEGLHAMVASRQWAFVTLTEADVRDVGRNDPCPCESGRKYKVCHEPQVEALARH
jgi:hypothetical protein